MLAVGRDRAPNIIGNDAVSLVGFVEGNAGAKAVTLEILNC